MPTTNVLFDPESDAVYDKHAAERERLCQVLFKTDPCPVAGAALEQMRAQFDEHHRACLRTFKTQHATVQEYADWRFSMAPDTVKLPADMESLTSVEEVDELCARLCKEADQAEHDKVASLPLGQPPGVTAFSGGTELRFWRVFSHRDLHPNWWAVGMKGVRTLMTVDQRDGCWHVCFMQDDSFGGAGVPNSMGRLATAIYREALAQAEQKRRERPGIRGWMVGVVASALRIPAISPSRFRFYEHLPPKRPMEEDFGLVRLSFRKGRFSSPGWKQYEVIPRTIASARHELKHDVTMHVSWV